MDETALHRAHAQKLLSEAGADLSGPSAAEIDPQLANAQAATALRAHLDSLPNAPTSAAQLYAPPGTPPPQQQSFQDFAAQQLAPPVPPGGAPQADPNAAASFQGQPQQQPVPPQPQQPQQRLPSELITGPADLAVAAGNTRDKALGYLNQDTAKDAQIVRDTAHLDQQQAAAEKPFVDSMAAESQRAYNHINTVAQAVDQQQQLRMAHYQTVQDEMSKMAVEQPKDLMGQAGVNSLLGNIAIFLGGAGVNGFHENHNLQMIQSMAERNIAAQKNRYEMLSRVGQGDQTLYGMLQNKLQNTSAVENTLKNAYADTYAAHLKQVGSQFADKRTQLRVQLQLQKLDEYKHQNTLMYDDKLAKDSQGAIALADTQTQQHLAAQAAAHTAAIADAKFGLAADTEGEKRKAYVRENSFTGLIGTANPKEHKDLATVWGGARNMISNIDEAKKLMMANKNAANARAYVALKNINLGEAKKFFNTGARLEPKEVQMMEAVGISWPMYCEAMMNGGQGLTGTQIAKGLEVVQALIARNAYGSLKAGNPGLEWDKSDPLMGRFAPGQSEGTQDYERQAEKNYGPEKGRDEVSALPAYDPTQLAGEGD